VAGVTIDAIVLLYCLFSAYSLFTNCLEEFYVCSTRIVFSAGVATS
jgi:hypothetical protein